MFDCVLLTSNQDVHSLLMVNALICAPACLGKDHRLGAASRHPHQFIAEERKHHHYKILRACLWRGTFA